MCIPIIVSSCLRNRTFTLAIHAERHPLCLRTRHVSHVN